MNCKNCGSMIDDDALFCAECGTHVEKSNNESTAICPNCGNKLDNDAEFCNSCGKHVEKNEVAKALLCPGCKSGVDDDAEFCGNCGLKLTQDEPPASVICPNCGALIQSDAEFCNNCGAMTAAFSLTPPILPQTQPMLQPVYRQLGNHPEVDPGFAEHIRAEEERKKKNRRTFWIVFSSVLGGILTIVLLILLFGRCSMDYTPSYVPDNEKQEDDTNTNTPDATAYTDIPATTDYTEEQEEQTAPKTTQTPKQTSASEAVCSGSECKSAADKLIDSWKEDNVGENAYWEKKSSVVDDNNLVIETVIKYRWFDDTKEYITSTEYTFIITNQNNICMISNVICGSTWDEIINEIHNIDCSENMNNVIDNWVSQNFSSNSYWSINYDEKKDDIIKAEVDVTDYNTEYEEPIEQTHVYLLTIGSENGECKVLDYEHLWSSKIETDDEKEQDVSANAYKFSMDSVKGGTITNEDYLGKPLCIWMWWSYCPHCRDILWDIDSLSQQSEQLYGFNVVSVIVPGDKERSRAEFTEWYKELNLKIDVVFDDGQQFKQDAQTGVVPLFIILNSKGEWIHMLRGKHTNDDIIDYILLNVE